MKRLPKIITLLLFCFLVVSPILAQETNTPTTSPVTARQEKLQEIRTRVREKIEVRHQLIQEHRATIAAKLTERRQERARLFFNRLTKRFQTATSRLRRLTARIDSRLAKIEAEGEEIDTTDVKATLATTKEKLDEAETALAEAQAGFGDILNNENPEEAFADVKDLIKGTKQQLVEVHRLLVHLIGDIKGLRVGQEE
ncbi:MAG TPA: hypothetical protein VMX76_01975 [Nevskiaceae bacterium]|nr:hypothetical protein [Nevskiaceae bacterium]